MHLAIVIPIVIGLATGIVATSRIVTAKPKNPIIVSDTDKQAQNYITQINGYIDTLNSYNLNM
jgi:hypothetical protein